MAWNEVLRWAATLQVDLRDLVEGEIAYGERVTVKTVQRWRCEGSWPPYRYEVGIRYPVTWYWEWRHKGRQMMTAQRVTRGRRGAGQGAAPEASRSRGGKRVRWLLFGGRRAGRKRRRWALARLATQG